MSLVTLRQQWALLNAEPLFDRGDRLIAPVANNAKLTRNNQWTT